MVTPAGIPPPVNPNDPGRGPMAVAVTWVFTILAMMTTAMWFWARKKRNMSPGWDCWIMMIATLIRLTFQCTITYSLRYGLGKHDKDLWPWDLIQILKWNWIALPGAVVTAVLARISVTILLIRLFGTVYRWFMWFLIVITMIQIISGMVLIPVTFLQATPRRALWDIFMTDAYRWDPRVWLYTAYFFQSFNSFSDLTYVAFPVYFIWGLQMPLRDRIGLILVMCLSIFTMIMSVLKTYWIYTASNSTQNSVDVQYNAIFQVVFGVLEQCVVIIMGCIPSIRHVVRLDFKVFSSLGSSITNFFTGSRSKATSSDATNPATGGYYDLEGRSVSKLDKSAASKDDGSLVVTTYPRNGSNDGSVPDNQVRRTDEVTVSYSDPRDRTRREQV